ncbi:MAG: stage 0 sporulation protein, partial [Clostridiales bacterium]|nr:stage 0 sporulation protein [Clostridiales bacterium]
VGIKVSTPEGEGIVVDTNILRGIIKVKLVNGEETDIKEYVLADIRALSDE